MKDIDQYYKKMGSELTKLLDGKISFDELIERIDPNENYDDFKADESTKLIWHTIYQYQLDIDSDNSQRVEDVKYWMTQISLCMSGNRKNLRLAISKYYNEPSSREF